MYEQSFNILYIEDESTYFEVVKRMLEMTGLFRASLHWVDSIAGGCEEIGKNNYDVVLLDLDLPDSSGILTVETFRTEYPDIPAIVVSGAYDGDALLRSIQWNIQDFLVKGEFDSHLLAKSVLYAVETSKIKQSLFEKQQLIEQLLESIPNPVFFKDNDGVYIGCNQAFCNLLGLRRDHIIGSTVFDIVSKPFSQRYHDKDLELIRTGGTQKYEDVLLGNDGAERAVIFYKATFPGQQDSVGGLIGVILDITDRKRYETALKRSEQKFRTIFNSSPDAMLIVDTESLEIVEVNNAFFNMTGYCHEETLGRNLNDIELAAECNCNENEANGSPYACINREMQMPTKDGDSITVLCTKVSLNYDDHARFLLIRRDITKLKELQNELQQSHKLESVGRLAAGVAHEINTPMQYVNDNLEFLQESFLELLENLKTLDLTPEQAEKFDLEYFAEEAPMAFQQALEGVNRVTEIVQAMKSFAHPGSDKKQPVDLAQLIESTITVAKNEWKYVADVELDIPPNMPRTPCFPGELRQTLLNLLINAAHAIETMLQDSSVEKGLIIIRASHTADHVVIEVEDNGGGIPEEARQHVFEPFFTTKDVGVGSGQGLAISYNVIVKKHGGTIDFHSETGKGTTFVITLPFEENT